MKRIYRKTDMPRPFAFTLGISFKHAYNFSSATDSIEMYYVCSLVNSTVKTFGSINVRQI